MNVLTSVSQLARAVSLRASGGSLTTLRDPAQWLVDWMGGTQSATGIRVSPDTAMQSTAVFSCVKVITQDVAKLPLSLYRRLDGGGKTPAMDHPLFELLHSRPNDWQNSFEFREMMQGHLLLRGNAYAQILYGPTGQVEQLIPLHPDYVRPFWMKGGAISYIYTPPPGAIIAYDYYPFWGPRQVLLRSQVLHLRGLSTHGLLGLSPIQQAREAVGLALATEEYGARFFANGTTPSGVLTHPNKLGKEAYDRLKESTLERQTSLQNAHKMMVLEEGMKWEALGLNNKDSQFLETRLYQKREICALYRIPPHKVGDLERATFSNIEEQNIEYVGDCLMPWVVCWEHALKRDLLLDAEQRTMQIRFVIQSLLRGKVADRMALYQSGRQWGYLNADDIREMEDMNPLPDGLGQEYLRPMNMQVVGEELPPALAPAPDPTPPQGPDLAQHQQGQRERRAQDQAQRRAEVIKSRLRLQAAYQPAIHQAVQRGIRKEIKAVGAAAKKYLSQRSAQDFELWLREFYKTHQGQIATALKPAVLAYAKALASRLADELDDDELDVTDEMETGVERFTEAVASARAHSAAGQLAALVGAALSQQGDVLEAVQQRLSEWDQTAAEAMTHQTLVQGSGMITKMAYAAAGVPTVQWVAASGNPCPLCQQLDGKTAPVRGAFLQQGDVVDPGDDKTAPLTVTSAHIGHPPLHAGCDCMLLDAEEGGPPNE